VAKGEVFHDRRAEPQRKKTCNAGHGTRFCPLEKRETDDAGTKGLIASKRKVVRPATSSCPKILKTFELQGKRGFRVEKRFTRERGGEKRSRPWEMPVVR